MTQLMYINPAMINPKTKENVREAEMAKLKELKEQGFDEEKITLSYVGSEVNYGDPIYLKVMYEYDIDFPIIGYKSIPMEVERVSVSKRWKVWFYAKSRRRDERQKAMKKSAKSMDITNGIVHYLLF